MNSIIIIMGEAVTKRKEKKKMMDELSRGNYKRATDPAEAVYS